MMFCMIVAAPSPGDDALLDNCIIRIAQGDRDALAALYARTRPAVYGFALSILKADDGDPSCCCRYFFGYDHPKAGEGRFIHTYQENRDPLPSFEGEPRKVAITAPDATTLAN